MKKLTLLFAFIAISMFLFAQGVIQKAQKSVKFPDLSIANQNSLNQLKSTKDPEVVYFFCDFDSNMCSFTTVNVDGNADHLDVSLLGLSFDAGWLHLYFTGDPDWSMGSSSFFDPPGQADRWLISPAITIGTNTILVWDARSHGLITASTGEAYEVLISTTGGSGPLDFTDPPVFTTLSEVPVYEWNQHIVQLEPAGYSNTTIYIAFRNVTNNGQVILIDNIKVETPPPNELVLEEIYPIFYGEGFYSMTPISQIMDINFKGKIKNSGYLEQTNITLNVNINDDSTSVYNETSPILPSLSPQNCDTLNTLTPFTPAEEVKDYTAVFTVSQSEIDDVPSNNVDSIMFSVTESVFARDYAYSTDISPSLFVGCADGDFIGTSFWISNDCEVSSISVYIAEASAGTMIIAKLYKYDSLFLEFIEVIASQTLNITALIVNSWITIPLEKDGLSEFITGNNWYTAGVECYWGSDNLLFGGDNTGPHDYLYSVCLRLSGDWYYAYCVPMMRLNIGNTTISGIVYEDINENGVKDSLEQSLPGQLVKLTPGPYYSSTNNSGKFYFSADTGNYSITYIPQQYWYLTSIPSSYYVTLSDTNYIDSLEFGIKARTNVQDVAAYYTGTQSQAGFEAFYWIIYKNWGTITTNGTIFLQYDTLLTFISSTISPDNQTENIIEWNYDTLASFEERKIKLCFQVPGFQYFGDTLISNVWIEPIAGDTNINNNYDTLLQVVTGSYDPNDKLLSPTGVGAEGYVLHGQKLTYTIRFQNTGTDTAHTVVIKDTINENLNIETFELLASSHTIKYTIEGTGILTFTFENILLPDSNVNEPESHGFVKFSAEPKDSLPDYTEVTNKAYIFFDFNPPIVTNEVLNTYVTEIPIITNVTKIIKQPDRIIIYPNPFNSNTIILFSNPEKTTFFLNVMDITGKKIRTYKNIKTNTIELEKGNLTSGIYFYQLIGEDGTVLNGKMVIE